eukprot:jgi/Tetstr1/454165/TSEL_041084.t1
MLLPEDTKAIMGKVLSFITTAVQLVAVIVLIWVAVTTPLRAGGPHNFARDTTNSTAAAFRDMVARFWEFYGPEMDEWWRELVQGDPGTAKEICDEWRDRGKHTVFNMIYQKANQSGSGVRVGDVGLNVLSGFYAYPGRDLSGMDSLDVQTRDQLRIDSGAQEWPSLSPADAPADPAADFDLWFDYETFDPRQVIRHDDPLFDTARFIRNMQAVERHDLLMCALPRFVDTLHARHQIFRHIPIADITDTVRWIQDHGAGYESPELLPKFLLRLGVKHADSGCTRLAAERLRGAVDTIEGVLVHRVYAAVAGNTALAKSIARSVDMATLLNFEEVNECAMAERIISITAETGSALFHANRALRAFRGVQAASHRLADFMDSGYVNTLLIKQFVRSSSRTFENSISDLVECLHLANADGRPDRNALAAEYALWHGALDVLRAVEDDTLDETLVQLRTLTEDVGAEDNAIMRACGTSVERRVRAMYHEYVNAVNCAVYMQGRWEPELDRRGHPVKPPRRVYTTLGYLEDAKQKFNTRYVNPLAAENFYATYFNDLFIAHWAKDTYDGGVPRADCKDCFKPHISPLGTVYNIESLREFTIRYWRSRNGVGESMFTSYKKSVRNALRGALLTCEFSAAFVRKLMGEEFDERGYYGGMSNRVHVYNVSMKSTDEVWSIRDDDWITLDEMVTPVWVWEDVEHGIDIAFEDCSTGGTVLYTRYPSPDDDMIRYATADRYGRVHTDNLVFMGAMNFSLCSAGASHEKRKVEGDGLGRIRDIGNYTEVDGSGMSPPGDMSEQDITDRARATTFETFAAEPKPASAATPAPPDYCYASDFGGGGGPDVQAGLFQVIDVEDPPDRMTIESERRVLLVSRSERDADPRYANRRLLVIGYDGDASSFGPVLIPDTPENRGRAVLKLTMRSLSTTGEAVLGFPTMDAGYYPFFLDKDAARKSVKASFNRNTWLAILVAGLVIAAAAVAIAVTAGGAAPIAAAAIGGVSGLIAAGVTTSAVGAMNIAHNMRSGGALGKLKQLEDAGYARSAMEVMLDADQVKVNNLASGSSNPFEEKTMRYMLVLEKPGLWPEFSLVPYVRPTQTVGSDDPNGADPDASIVPRDELSGASRVVFIPARDTNRNSTRLLYPPIITTHAKHNVTKKGTPFYIYAPHKRMFLSPGDPPLWVNADGDPGRTSVQVRLKNTDLVFDIYRKSSASGAKVQLFKNRGSDNQMFRRLYEGDAPAAQKHLLPFKLRVADDDRDRCVATVRDTDGMTLKQFTCANGDMWEHVDGRLRATAPDGGFRYVEAVMKNNRPSGGLRWTAVATAAANQQFVIDPMNDCGGSLVYGEKDLIRGRLPGGGCVKPWYMYELSPRDMTADQRARVDAEADRNA